MPLWQVTLRLPGGDRRQVLREFRQRAGDVVIRDVSEDTVTVEVAAADEPEVRRQWPGSAAISVFRVDGGWSGDWWDGPGPGLLDSDEVLGPAGDDPDGHVLVAVPFHHFAIDGSGRCLTVFWNGTAACAAGDVTADERDDGVIVTVTERCPRGGAIAAAGEGRRATLMLHTALGTRPVWDRRPGVQRPRA